ncbi:hypothetical protein OHA70_07680 [Kribbella sp. NBC_00382]|uniref:hypothetical protein n=1 Tax=Kribbella sp. NBC_00382 TaxID=2975967 RepID=UPI002E21A541
MSLIAVRRMRVWLPVVVACLSLGLGGYGVVGLFGGVGGVFGGVGGVFGGVGGVFGGGPVGIGGLAGVFGADGLGFLPGRVGAGAVAVLGLSGVPAAVGHGRTEWSPAAYRPLLWFTGLQVVGAAGVLVASGAGPGMRVYAVVLGAGWAALGVRGLRGLRYSRMNSHTISRTN